MKILISLSAANDNINLKTLNKVIKTYFKKTKQYDSHYKTIIDSCLTLTRMFNAKPHGAIRTSYQIMEDLLNKKSGELKFQGADDKSHYSSIDPTLLKIGNLAFKKMLEIVTKEDVTAANEAKWYLAQRLASVCNRIFAKIGQAEDIQDFKRYKMLTDTLSEVGITYEN
jgi:hypothetical protein